MMSFGLFSDDALRRGSWVRDAAGCWRDGASWIAPLPHPAVESIVLRSDEQVVIVAREAIRGRVRRPGDGSTIHSAEELDSAVRDLRDWPGDFVALQIRRGTEPRDGAPRWSEAVVMAGRWGSAPLYLCADEHSLHGSWDPGSLPYRPAESNLDPRRVVERLTLTGGYSPRTIWDGLIMVPERARASWRPGASHLDLIQPSHAEHHLPRTLKPDADVLGGYGTLLSSSVRARDVRADDMVVEVSGGTDSATVALTIGNEGHGVGSYGLLVGGAAGDQQVSRRHHITATAGMADRVIDASCFLPLAPPDVDRPGARRLPGEEPYEAAVRAALATTSASVVMTGIGGDELCALRLDEASADTADPARRAGPVPAAMAVLSSAARDILDAAQHAEPEWPVTEVSASALRACASRAPTFLREGRWPVSPLCSPELIRFTEWLPASWRSEKAVARWWLASQGLPHDVVWPALRENFVPVMQLALRRHGIPSLTALLHGEAMAVVDLGYVDADRLRAVLGQAQRASDSVQVVPSYLHEVLVVERAIRAWTS